MERIAANSLVLSMHCVTSAEEIKKKNTLARNLLNYSLIENFILFSLRSDRHLFNIVLDCFNFSHHNENEVVSHGAKNPLPITFCYCIYPPKSSGLKRPRIKWVILAPCVTIY